MAVVAITPTSFSRNTASGDLPESGMTAATSTTDGWEITLPSGATPERVLIQLKAVTNADTVVINAGESPALHRGLGSLSVALTAGQVKFITLEGARFMRASRKLKIVPGQTTTLIRVFVLPAGGGGGY